MTDLLRAKGIWNIRLQVCPTGTGVIPCRRKEVEILWRRS